MSWWHAAQWEDNAVIDAAIQAVVDAYAAIEAFVEQIVNAVSPVVVAT